jgi:hypothetical protein
MEEMFLTTLSANNYNVERSLKAISSGSCLLIINLDNWI